MPSAAIAPWPIAVVSRCGAHDVAADEHAGLARTW